METSLDRTPIDQPTGCLPRWVGFFSALYLGFMLVYLVLRLLLGDQFWWLGLLNAFTIYLFTPLFILLPLVFLLRLWRMMIRLGVAALIGIIWFGPMFQLQHVTPTGAPSLTIATYNMQRIQTRFVENLDEIQTWLQENNVDILLLQEVLPETIESLDALADNYPEVAFDAEGSMAFVSRLRLIDVGAGEHFLRAVIDLNGVETTLYNVHFLSPTKNKRRTEINGMIDFITRYDETYRNRHIDAFLEHLAEEELPHIVGGDFNMSQHSIIYSSLAVVMDDSFREANHGLGATWPQDGGHWITPVPLLRLDYVWYSKPYVAVMGEVGPYFGSDHLPYVAMLELRSIGTEE